MHASALERRHRCIFGRQRPSAKVPGADRLPLFANSPGEAPLLFSTRSDGSRSSPEPMWLSPNQTTGECPDPGQPCGHSHHPQPADGIIPSMRRLFTCPSIIGDLRPVVLPASPLACSRLLVAAPKASLSERSLGRPRATSRTTCRLSGFRVCDTTARKHLTGDSVCLKRLL